MSTITTPNMDLNLPVPGTEPGPQWAQDLNTALTTIDDHNHTPGSGVQVPVAGVNVNSDLPMNSNNVSATRSVILDNQSSTLSTSIDKCNVYVTNGSLYFNNSSGTAIQITTGNAVNTATAGNISGIGGTQAALTYSDITKTFTFTQSSGVTANISGGSVSIYEDVTGTNPVVIKSPTSLANTYNLTLPAALPAQTNVMTLGTTGTVSSTTWDSVGSNMTSTGANAIASSMTATAADTLAYNTRTRGFGSGIGAVQSTGTSGSFSTFSVTPVQVTGQTAALTTTGKPVIISMAPFNSTSAPASILISNSGQGKLYITRDGTIISTYFFQNITSGGTQSYSLPAFTVDNTSAASHVYALLASTDGVVTISVNNVIMVVYEL